MRFPFPFRTARRFTGIWVIIAFSLVTSAARAQVTTEPYQWRNVEIVGGGFVPGIIFHPKERDLIYARTDIGGAYRWNPTTKRWIPLCDEFGAKDWNLYGAESIGLDPNDPKRVYLAAGTYINSWAGNGAILRSTDRGDTWQRTDMPFKMGGNSDGRSIGERLVVDPNDGRILFFGSRQAGLWKSADYGATWAQVNTFPAAKKDEVGIGFLLFDPRTGKRGKETSTLYAGTTANAPLLRSDDAGVTWKEIPNQPTGFIPHHARLTPDGTLFVTYSNAPGPNGVGNGAVWKCETEKNRWTDITPIQPGSGGLGTFGYAGLSVDTAHPGTLVVSTIDKWGTGDDIYRSTNNGATWKSLKLSAQMDSSASPFLNWGGKTASFGHWMGSVEINPFNPNQVLYVTGATIWGSDDVTAADKSEPTHWQVWAQGLEETAVIDLISPDSGAHLISALGDIGGFTHFDLTVSPPTGMHKSPLLGTTTGLAIAAKNQKIVARVGSGGGKIGNGASSIDGGVTWLPFASEPMNSRGSGRIAVSADGATLLWKPDGAGAAVSKDRGKSWTLCSGVTDSLVFCADSDDARVFYASDTVTRQMVVSEDGGMTFAKIGGKLPGDSLQLRATPNHSGDLWVVAGNGGLLHTSNGGKSVVKMETVSECRAMGFGKSAAGRDYPALYIVGTVRGVSGLFRSDNVGSSWVRINDDKHQFGTADVIIGDPRIYGRVYVGTNGRGILYADPAAPQSAQR